MARTTATAAAASATRSTNKQRKTALITATLAVHTLLLLVSKLFFVEKTFLLSSLVVALYNGTFV